MSWNRFDMSQRQLPHRGCSLFFYGFLLAVLLFFIVMFIIYKLS